MKHFLLIFSLLAFMISCKSDKENSKTKTPEEPKLTSAEKIANAYGMKNWDAVTNIQFTFNVDKDSSHFERKWIWSPKSNDVVMIFNTDTIRYNRNKIDSTDINADKAFINDKYWLLAPFNLIWDAGTTISDPEKEAAPISLKALNKITLTYSNEGGYTPGDAYDFYYNDDYIIEEWVFRKGNSETPTMMSTWENNQDFKGVLISLSHKKTADNWELYFSNVSIN